VQRQYQPFTHRKDFGELHNNNEWILPSLWLALWNVASPIGAMLGALSGSLFQDRVGRRLSLATASLLSAISVAIMFISYLPTSKTNRCIAFLVGKFVQGAATGAVMTATQTYLSEILPPVLRGSGMAFFPAFTLLGQLTGALVVFGCMGREKGYRDAFASQWPFSFVPILVAFLIPESPTYLIRKRKTSQAIQAQTRLAPANTDVQAAITTLTALVAHEEKSAKSASFRQCFEGKNLRRTMIVLFAMALPNFFGIPLLAKASYFLQICGMAPNLSIIFLILGIVIGLLANIISVWTLARFKRRLLLLSTLVLCAVYWTAMGIANCFHSASVVWITAAAMMLTILTAGLGVWPVSFAIAAETSSLRLRSKTQGLGWTMSAFSTAISGIALPYVVNPVAGGLRGKVGFTYAVSCLVAVAVGWWGVPEMKGRTVEGIDEMFEGGVGARAWDVQRERDVQGGGGVVDMLLRP
jgi:MFS family permease